MRDPASLSPINRCKVSFEIFFICHQLTSCYVYPRKWLKKAWASMSRVVICCYCTGEYEKWFVKEPSNRFHFIYLDTINFSKRKGIEKLPSSTISWNQIEFRLAENGLQYRNLDSFYCNIYSWFSSWTTMWRCRRWVLQFQNQLKSFSKI